MKQAVNSILTHLEGLPLEDRVKAAADVQELSTHPGWHFLRDLVAEAVEEQRDKVEFGTHEHEVYCAMHGRIRGLRFALSVSEAVIESGKRANQELRQIAEREDHK